MANVGKISVRVFPDTSKLRGELKTALERIKNNTKGKVTVELDLDKSSLVRVRKILKSLHEIIELNVDADTAAARQKIADIQENLRDSTLNVDADTGAARASIAQLTRRRIVDLEVNIKGAAAARAALSALSGGNVLGRLGARTGAFFKDFDGAAVRVSKAATALSAFSAAALAGVGNIATLAGSLAAMAPAALVLPGVLAAAAVGIGVFKAAMKDAKTVLGDLGPQFTALQDSISVSFWDRAAAPIREMVGTLLPEVSGGLSDVAHQLGGWATAFSGAISSAEGIADIQGIINRTADAIDIAGDGIGFFTSGLLTLANVGTSYLPALASGFNDISERFNSWIQAAYTSGDVFVWIDTALANLKLLGSVIGSVAGILGGVFSAASAAGGASLGGLASALNHIEGIVQGPVFQGALITVFQGAYAAISALTPAIDSIGNAFVALAPTISYAMSTAGKVVSQLVEALGNALANPALSSGIMEMFAGILVAAQALAPAIEALGPLIGAIAGAFGELVATLAPLVAQIVSELAPGFTQLFAALQPVISAIGDAFATALGAILPIISQVVQWVTQFMTQFPGLSAGILLAVAAVGAFIAVIVGIITAIAPVVGAIAGVVGAVGAIPVAIGLAIAAVGAVLVGLVVFIVSQWDAITAATQAAWEWVKTTITTAVDGVVSWIQTAWSGLVSIVSGIWQGVVSVVSSVWSAITSAVSTAVSAVGNFVSAGFQAVLSVVTSIMSSVLSFISSVWSSITSAISAAITTVRAFISAGFQAVLSIISSVLSSILSRVMSIFTSVVSAVSSAMTRFASVISSGVSQAVAFFVSLGSRIISTISGIAGRMVSMGGQIIQGLVNGITGAAGNVVSALKGVVDGAINAAKSALGIKSPSRVFRSIGDYTMQGFVKGVDGGASNAQRAMTRAIQPPAAASMRTPDLPTGTTGARGLGRGEGIVIENINGFTADEVVESMRRIIAQEEALYAY